MIRGCLCVVGPLEESLFVQVCDESECCPVTLPIK